MENKSENRLPFQTIGMIKRLCAHYKYNEHDLNSFAFIVMRKCQKEYTGPQSEFYRYLNRSIKNKLLDRRKNHHIKTVNIDEGIENFGENMATNVEVNDFLKFVTKTCSPKTSNFLRLYLHQPVKVQNYLLKNRLTKKKIGENIVFDYLGFCRKSRKLILEELKNARQQYQSI